MQDSVTLTKREVARFKARVDALVAMVDSFLMNGNGAETVQAKVVKRRKRKAVTAPPETV